MAGRRRRKWRCRRAASAAAALSLSSWAPAAAADCSHPTMPPCSQRHVHQQQPATRLCAGAAAGGSAQGWVGVSAHRRVGDCCDRTVWPRALSAPVRHCCWVLDVASHHLGRSWLARARSSVVCHHPPVQACARRSVRRARRCCCSGTATRSTPSRPGGCSSGGGRRCKQQSLGDGAPSITQPAMQHAAPSMAVQPPAAHARKVL